MTNQTALASLGSGHHALVHLCLSCLINLYRFLKIYAEKKFQPNTRLVLPDNSLSRASDWKARRNADLGSSPRTARDFCPRVSFQCRRCRMHQHLCACYCQTLAAVPLFCHTKTLQTLVGMGSAALAPAMPYPGSPAMVTRISCKGQ